MKEKTTDNFVLVLKAFVLAAASCLIWQSFILSDSYSLLFFREIDDYALQLVLRDFHEDLLEGKLTRWFSTVAYGYGNLFWVLNSILTLPFYLIKSDQAVMVLPRIFSIVLAIGSCWLISEIVLRLTGNRLLKWTSFASLVLVPALGEWALRLHVNSLHLFFGCLSFYCAFLNFQSNKKKFLYLAACCLGVSVGLKLTGIFWAPLIAIFVARFLLKTGQNREKLILVGALVVCFLICFVLSFNPSIIFSKQSAINSYNILEYYVKYKGVNIGPIENQDKLSSFAAGFLDSYWNLYFCGIVVFANLAFLKSNFRKEAGFVLASAFVVLWLTLTYLCLSLEKGPLYLQAYFYPIYPLLGLFWIPFDQVYLRQKRFYIWQMTVLLMLMFLPNVKSFSRFWLRISHAMNTENFKAQLELAAKMKPIFQQHLAMHKKLLVIQPPLTMTSLSQFENGVTIQTSAAFDLLRGTCEQGQADFVIFRSKDIPDQNMIEKNVPREMFQASREQILRFMTEKSCGGSKYELISDSHQSYVYARVLAYETK